MTDGPILHHLARGVHPGAIVQSGAPDGVALTLQNGTLWLDTSYAPLYRLFYWKLSTHSWQFVLQYPSGYVRDTEPAHAQQGTIWADTSTDPATLKVWDGEDGVWLVLNSTGIDASGHLATSCLLFPLGAELCNPSTDIVTLQTPTAEFTWNTAGITLPGGHRVQEVPA